MTKRRAVRSSNRLRVHPKQHVILPRAVEYLLASNPTPLKLPQSVVVFALDDLYNARLLSTLARVCKSWKADIEDSILWKTTWDMWYSRYKKGRRNTSIYTERLFGQEYIFYPEQFRRNLRSFDPFVMDKPVQGWLTTKLPPLLRLFKTPDIALSSDCTFIVKGHREALKLVITKSCCSCRECPRIETDIASFNGDILCGRESDSLFEVDESVRLRTRQRARPKRKATFRGSYAEMSCNDETRLQGFEDFEEGKTRYLPNFPELCYACSDFGTRDFFYANMTCSLVDATFQFSSEVLNNLKTISREKTDYYMTRDVANLLHSFGVNKMNRLCASANRGTIFGWHRCEYCSQFHP